MPAQAADAFAERMAQALLGGLNLENMGPTPGDERLRVQFSVEAVLNPRKSTETGQLVYDDREYIRIMVPGDKTLLTHREVTPYDKVRFAKYYQDWKLKGVNLETGTPLKLMCHTVPPVLSPAQVETFAFLQIRTVEQLADLADVNASSIMGGQKAKQQAKQYLERVRENAPLAKVQAELQQRDEELATLRKALAAQQEQMSRLEERLTTPHAVPPPPPPQHEGAKRGR